MTDALLIYPNPSQDSPVKGTALSIFYVGAAAEIAGLSIEYIDERFDGTKKVAELLKLKPSAVGISSMTGYQLKEAMRIFDYIKSVCPECKTILGGVHGSLLPEECIANEMIDFVVVGEGEVAFTELVRAIKNNGNFSKIKGIWRKEQGRPIKNEDAELLDVNTLPFPMTKKNKRYFIESSEAEALFYISSRGCPYRCSFCYNNVFNKRKWRFMPIEKIKNEISALHKELGFNYLFLNDDNIGSRQDRLKEIAVFLNSLGIKWGSCIRANNINEETVKIMSDNGCERFLLGVETGSERVLNNVLRKDLPGGLADIKKAVSLIAKTSIKPTYSFMSNIPSETRQEMKQSMDFADWIHHCDRKARLGFYVYAPYPGTELFETAKKNGYKMPSGIEEWSKMSLSNNENPIAENLYYISGLKFRSDISKIKFPGLYRLQILPLEILAKIRWRLRMLNFYGMEKFIIKRLFKSALYRIQKPTPCKERSCANVLSLKEGN